MIFLFFLYLYLRDQGSISTIDYTFFLQQLENENIQSIHFGEKVSEGTFLNAPADPGELDTRTGRRDTPPLNMEGEQAKLNERFRVIMPPNAAVQEKLYQRLEVAAQNDELVLSNEPSHDSNNFFLIFILSLLAGALLYIWILLIRIRNQAKSSEGE